MAQICYSWNDTEYEWAEIEFTWKEFCVIQKIARSGPKTVFSRKKREYKPEITEEDKRILIGLVLRISGEQIEFEAREEKEKRLDVTVSAEGVELTLAESNKIKLKIVL